MILKLKDGSAIATGTLRMSDPVSFKYVGNKSTPLAEFGVKVDNRRGEDGQWSSTWINCKCWNDLAGAVKNLPGGASVFVAGRFETRSWDGNDGETKQKTELVCDFVTTAFTGGGSRSTPPAVDIQYGSPDTIGGFSELDEDDPNNPLPF